MENLAECEAEDHGGGDTDGGVGEAGAAGVGDLLDVHAEAEGDDGGLEEELGEAGGFGAEGVVDREPEGDAADQRDGWGDDAAAGDEEAEEEEGAAVEELVRCRMSGRMKGGGFDCVGCGRHSCSEFYFRLGAARRPSRSCDGPLGICWGGWIYAGFTTGVRGWC